MSETVSPAALEQALKEHFGFEAFRVGQRELIEAVLAGRDVLGVLPTGGGKSLTYQLPSILLKGVTVVISPLIALMKDQVDAFNKRGGSTAIALHSNMTARESQEALVKLHGGEASLLYIAPERLVLPGYMERVVALKPELFVIDEAHCVSQWGYDFRPSYLKLRDCVDRLRPCPVLALTATATPQTRQDIVRSLNLSDPLVHVASFDRPNLRFEVHPCGPGEKPRRLRRILKNLEGRGSQIVYVGRRKDADKLAQELCHEGLGAVAYHAGMHGRSRRIAQETWLSGERPIAVATVAFGMGIDKADVRAVVHYQHPASLEAYYQEAGRAGRDGDAADCIVLFSRKDVSLAQFFLRKRYPNVNQVRELYRDIAVEGTHPDKLVFLGGGDLSPEQVNVAMLALQEQGVVWQNEEGLFVRRPGSPDRTYLQLDNLFKRKNADYRRLDAVVDYCQEVTCHRTVLLRYFGETHPRDQKCGNCSACSGGTAQVAVEAAMDEAVRVFKGYRSTLEAQGMLTARVFAQFLGGSAAKGIRPGWKTLKAYGVLSHFRMTDLNKLAERALFRARQEAAGDVACADAVHADVARAYAAHADVAGVDATPPDLARADVAHADVRAGALVGRGRGGASSAAGSPEPEDGSDALMAAFAHTPPVWRASAEGLRDDQIFWKSKERSFTVGELKQRQVQRDRGLKILSLVGEHADDFAPSMVVSILRGGAQSKKTRTPELVALPEYGSLKEVPYDDLLADVLAMHAKAYLCCATQKTKKLSLTHKGLAALNS